MSQVTNGQKSGDILPQFRSLALISLGSNLPSCGKDAVSVVRSAVSELASQSGVIRAASRLFRTPAFPAGSGPDFVNAVVSVATNCTPAEMLVILHRTETAFGRVRDVRWGPRTLDLDLLAFDDLVLPDLQTYQRWADLPLAAQMREMPDQLILPHPRLQDRGFVLVPLAEVAPDWVHPVTGLSVLQMCAALPASLRTEVEAL